MWVWSKANERKIIPKAIPKLSDPCENQAWLKTLEKTWFGLSEIGMIEDLKKTQNASHILLKYILSLITKTL